MSSPAEHVPVMPKEVKEYLSLQKGGCFVDATLGLGGHTFLLAPCIGPEGRIIGIDRDAQALKQANVRLGLYAEQCTFVHDNFRNIDKVLSQLGISQVDGMLFDLGISSFQLNDPERGFSFQVEGPLDMRMNQENFLSAYDLINSLSEREISFILKEYGEERWHKRIARYLVSHRPIETTTDLKEAVLKAIPAVYKYKKRQRIHPATRTFQAIRIVVNRELEALDIALDRCIEYLKPRARVCVIAFHSLEDRVVKNKFRDFARAGRVKLLTKKPLFSSEEEVIGNPRARSARLRVAEKV